MNQDAIDLLVIDDDEINIFITRKIVEKIGLNVNMATKSNGLEALNYIKDCLEKLNPLPHLILLDINMPIMNGWEFLEAYNKLSINQNVDIFILSSSIYENDIEKTKEFPFVKGFISKPLSTDRLKELLVSVGA